MPRKRPNLKHRLEALRGDVPSEPPAQVKVTLTLDNDLHRLLNELAGEQGMRLESYIGAVLDARVEKTHGGGDEQDQARIM